MKSQIYLDKIKFDDFYFMNDLLIEMNVSLSLKFKLWFHFTYHFNSSKLLKTKNWNYEKRREENNGTKTIILSFKTQSIFSSQ